MLPVEGEGDAVDEGDFCDDDVRAIEKVLINNTLCS